MVKVQKKVLAEPDTITVGYFNITHWKIDKSSTEMVFKENSELCDPIDQISRINWKWWHILPIQLEQAKRILRGECVARCVHIKKSEWFNLNNHIRNNFTNLYSTRLEVLKKVDTFLDAYDLS
jgi:hypothetical protein